MPGYYDGASGLQPYDVIDEFGLDFYEGNIIKYIIRWRKKNGIDDLHKARTYIDELIKRAQQDTATTTPVPPAGRPTLVVRTGETAAGNENTT
jgi:methyl coenzyme M reductase subunit C-like uncharacterized protein (methanogenesis marker protein 7)